MPRSYTRKTNRASWSQESLTEAVTKINEGHFNIWEAAKAYDIPYRTLKRRIDINNLSKGTLGRPASLSNYEINLVNYIKKLESAGFPATSFAIRRLAFTFAAKNNLSSTFNQERQVAGYDWFQNFMRRHPTLSIRKAEGVSIARGISMCREEVNKYFELLLKICEENDLFTQPSKIYNVDESGLQLNNNPGKVIASKGVREVHHVTSTEKGETISVVGCCNAEGKFLPPYCLFKGKRKRPEFKDGLPPGSRVEMGEKSAYVNSQIFLNWLRDHFLPRKENGKVLLILDGHSSHCSDINVLDFAIENGIILLCLPSHTTHYLQPLDRAFFKPLKTYWQKIVTNWISSHPGRKLTRYQFGSLLCSAWNLAATVGNGTSGFRACGIFPYNPQSISEHAYKISSASKVSQHIIVQAEGIDESAVIDTTLNKNDNAYKTTETNMFSTDINSNEHQSDVQPKQAAIHPSYSANDTFTLFDSISPVPTIKTPRATKRKQHAQELTSSENRDKMRKKKTTRDELTANKNKQKSVCKKSSITKRTRILESSSESSEAEENVTYQDSSSDMSTVLHVVDIIMQKMVQSVIG